MRRQIELSQEPTEVRGLLIEAAWDDAAATFRGALVTDGGRSRLLLAGPKGPPLTDLVGHSVAVRGAPGHDALGRRGIVVDGLQVLIAGGTTEWDLPLPQDGGLADSEAVDPRGASPEVAPGWPA